MYWETVSPLLREVLEEMMNESLFDSFRLVGGTALSLQLGHRKSIDIDLFTAKNYGSIDFELIDKFLKRQFEFALQIILVLLGWELHIILAILQMKK
jgi:hypothetical protein